MRRKGGSIGIGWVYEGHIFNKVPAPLMSIGFSLDCGVRVIGSLNGIMYVEKRKMNGEIVESGLRSFSSLGLEM